MNRALSSSVPSPIAAVSLIEVGARANAASVEAEMRTSPVAARDSGGFVGRRGALKLVRLRASLADSSSTSPLCVIPQARDIHEDEPPHSNVASKKHASERRIL